MSTFSSGTLLEKFFERRKVAEAHGKASSNRKRKLPPTVVPPIKQKAKTDKEGGDDEKGDGFDGLLTEYKKALDQCEREKEDKQKEFDAFKGKMDELHAVYLFGLKSVSSLQDLRDAPDAILPGNFPNDDMNKSKTE